MAQVGGARWASRETPGGSEARVSASLCISAALLAHGPSPLHCGSWVASAAPDGPTTTAFSLCDSLGIVREVLEGFLGWLRKIPRCNASTLFWFRQLGRSTEPPLPGGRGWAPHSQRNTPADTLPLLSHVWNHLCKGTRTPAATLTSPTPLSSWLQAPAAQLHSVPGVPYISFHGEHRAFAYTVPSAWNTILPGTAPSFAQLLFA